MLSNSRGYSAYSTAQTFRRDAASRLTTPCPTLQRSGRCRAYHVEQTLRHKLAKDKEAELLKRATEMYELQMDLIATGDDVDGGGGGDVVATTTKNKTAFVAHMLDELKQEPAYLQWNLDAEVEERLVQLKMRRCPYHHRVGVQQSLKRARQAVQHEDAKDAASASSPTTTTTTGGAAPSSSNTTQRVRNARAEAAWAQERARVFGSFTHLQRLIACVLWQRIIAVPQRLVRDVRRAMEKEAEMKMMAEEDDAAHNNNNNNNDDDVDAMREKIDAYLASSDFCAMVEKEEERIITHVVCRPDVGVVDLSSLPGLVAYLSQHQKKSFIHARTRAYFEGEDDVDDDVDDDAQRGNDEMKKNQRTFAPLAHGRVSEKEVQLSTPALAEELVEVLEWMFVVFNRERKMGRTPWETEEDDDDVRGGTTRVRTSRRSTFTIPQLRHHRLVLRSLALRRCQLTDADAIIASLHKHHAEESLLALDLSHNRLSSMRFLFALRSHFAQRLLRLSLKDNLITRKPEYQEQVRRCLPRLRALDGAPIRRPPLAMPHALPTSAYLMEMMQQQDPSASSSSNNKKMDGGLNYDEVEAVLDSLSRIVYVWESRRIPHTTMELKAYNNDGHRMLPEVGWGEWPNAPTPTPTSTSSADADADASPTYISVLEEDADADNFPHRYLHPSCIFSLSLVPGLTFADPSRMKLAREVEHDLSYTGMRLSAADMADLRIFDVAMKNCSRNLLAGRVALPRVSRGADHCMLAYQTTIYAERFSVSHNLHGAAISIVKMDLAAVKQRTSSSSSSSRNNNNKKPTAATFGGAQQTQPVLYVVTLHGAMTWTLPSMHQRNTLACAYDRVLTFTAKELPAQNRTWERRRSPKMVLSNDVLMLRSMEDGDGAYYTAHRSTRVAQLVVELGLESCRDGVALVSMVMERCTSDAAERAALDALVFGPPTPPLSDDASLANAEQRNEKMVAAEEAITELLNAFLDENAHDDDDDDDDDDEQSFRIFSLLNRPVAEEADIVSAPSPWGSTPHVLPRSLIVQVAELMNAHHTQVFDHPDVPPTTSRDDQRDVARASSKKEEDGARNTRRTPTRKPDSRTSRKK